MRPTIDILVIGEGDVELGGASVARATDGHMSTETRDTNGESETANSDDIAPNTQEYSPSLVADVAGNGAMEEATSESGRFAPGQCATDELDRERKGRRTPETQSPPSAPEADGPTIIRSPGSRGSNDSEATITSPRTDHTRSDMKIAAEPLVKVPRPSRLTPRLDPSTSSSRTPPRDPRVHPPLHRSVHLGLAFRRCQIYSS